MKNKFIFAFIFTIFLLSFASAGLLDSKNILNKEVRYDKYKAIEINNLFGKTKFSGEITEHTEFCGINCFSTMEIYTSGDEPLIDSVVFKTLQEDGKWIEQPIRSYDFYWKSGGTKIEVDDYEIQCKEVGKSENGTSITECNRVKTGTHLEDSPEWTKFKEGDIFEKGTYTIKLVGQKKPSRTVDWIIKTNGKVLDEWATWGSETLDDNLISYYKLDEESGTIIDSLGINNGTNNGSTNTTGKIIYGYSFDGDNDYINLSNGINPTSEITISAWIKTQEIEQQGIIGKWNWNSGGEINNRSYYLQLNSTNYLQFFVSYDGSNANSTSITGGTQLSLDTWYLVSAVYNGTNIMVYVNGTLDGITSASNYSLANKIITPTCISGQNCGGTIYNIFNGTIDEVGIWNSSLTSSEINLLYNSGSGLAYPFGVTLNSPSDASIQTSNQVTTNSTATVTGGATLKNVTLYDNSTGTWEARNSTDITGTTNTTTFDNTYTGSQTYLWNHLWCDSDDDCGFASSNFTFSIDTTAPTIDLISPNSTYNYLKQGDTLYLSGYANDSNLDTVWYEYNGTNTTFSATTATLFNESITQADSSKLSLILWANDTAGNVQSQVVSWDYLIFEIDRIYSLTAYETEVKDFIINLTYNNSLFIPTVYLNYDGTNYSTINIGSGNEGKFKNTISIGLIDGSTSKEFYWWILANDSVIKTESNNQTINNLIFQICNGTYTNKTLNFKFYDESKNTLLNTTSNPLTFETYFEFWIGNGDIKKSYNYNVQNTTTGSYDFCISPANFSFSSNIQISYSAEDYSKRESSYNELNLTNILQNISFYLLPTELSTKFTHYVRQEIESLAGVSVEVYKFLISTGNYTLISTKITDENGRFVEWLELDQKYKYIVKSEEISLTEQEKQAICAVSPCEITLQIDEISLNAFNELNAYFAQNVDYNLTYNKSTSTFKLSFLDITGTANYWRLHVYKSNSNNDTLNSICNLYAYSSSGELECDTSLYFGEITAKVYISRSPEKLVDFLIRVNENITPVLSVSGLLASIIILLVIIFTGTRNPTSALLMLPFGLIILKFIGFMPLTWGWIAGITIFILAISYKMNT